MLLQRGVEHRPGGTVVGLEIVDLTDAAADGEPSAEPVVEEVDAEIAAGLEHQPVLGPLQEGDHHHHGGRGQGGRQQQGAPVGCVHLGGPDHGSRDGAV